MLGSQWRCVTASEAGALRSSRQAKTASEARALRSSRQAHKPQGKQARAHVRPTARFFKAKGQ